MLFNAYCAQNYANIFGASPAALITQGKQSKKLNIPSIQYEAMYMILKIPKFCLNLVLFPKFVHMVHIILALWL